MMMRPIFIFFVATLTLAGCGPKEMSYVHLVATQRFEDPEAKVRLTVGLIRRFEKMRWCESEAEWFRKEDFTATCRPEDPAYAPMFEGKPVGRWYALQRMGAFSPTVVMYEFEPPMPDAVMYRQLVEEAPHILKFAALHEAPAEVRIFSPAGEVPWGDAAKKNPVVFELSSGETPETE